MNIWRIETHCHTNISPCATLKPQKLINLAKKLGIKALVITDHDNIEAALHIRKIAPFFVIIGQEISTKDGEVLGYFLSERVPPGLSVEQTIELIREQKGLVGIPHPFDPFRKNRLHVEKLEEILTMVDCLEVWNARNIFVSSNEKAERMAEKHGILKIAGSDAHTSFEVGRSGMFTTPFSNANEFLESLRTGSLIKQKSPMWVHGVTKIKKTLI
ncbi:MAG: PHP domain-containing protein [bacterium]